MGLHHQGGPRAPRLGLPSPFAPAARQLARRVIAPFAALGLVAGITAGCGAASTPLEVYQNCLRCGYDFTEPLPTAQAVLRRSES